MKYKKILIILSVFVALAVFMSSVSATEGNTALDTDEVVDSNYGELLAVEESSAGNDNSGLELEGDDLKASNNNNAVGATVNVDGNSFSDIQTVIDNADPGDTIILNGLYTGSGTQIQVNKDSLTFIGENDATLDAKELSRILYITANDITLKDISFENGKDNNGGAICWMGVDGTLFNCSFENNTAADWGGAIYLDRADCKVFNCSFENNLAGFTGGAIYWDNYSPNGTVSDCSFENNLARMAGAIYWSSPDGKVFNCSFVNNTASNSAGGAIYWSGADGNVSNCSFVNNTARVGGAIIWQATNGTVFNCSFENNKASNAGAIYWSSPDGKVFNCSFENNTGTEGGGGAILWDNLSPNGTVSDCSFENNLAQSIGGAIYWSGADGNVSNCSFENNKASYAGAIMWYYENFTVFNCIFVNNTGVLGGGAIMGSGANGNVSNCIFVNNTAERLFGGAIYWTGKNGKVSDSIFIDNKCPHVSLVLTKTSLTFTGNENYINGIYASQDVSFDNVTFWNGAVVNTDDAGAINSNQEAGINITLEVYDYTGALVDNVTLMTNTSGQISYDYSYLGKYTIKAYHPDDRYYTYIKKTISFSTYDIVVLNNQTFYYIGTPTTVRLNATIQDNKTGEVINPGNVKLVFILPNGTEIEATYDNGVWVADCTFEEFSTYLIVARVEPKEFDFNRSSYSLSNVFAGTVVLLEEPIADIELLLEVSSNNVEYGDVIDLIVTVRNNGPFNATNVIADITIPDGLTYLWDSINGDPNDRITLKATPQTYDESTGKWNIGDLAVGESTNMTIQLRADYVGEKEISAGAKADQPDPDLTNNNKTVIIKSTNETEPENETDVPDNETDVPDSEIPENETGSNKPFENESVLSKNATGNPIIALLLVLIALGSTQLRRFKK